MYLSIYKLQAFIENELDKGFFKTKAGDQEYIEAEKKPGIKLPESYKLFKKKVMGWIFLRMNFFL